MQFSRALQVLAASLFVLAACAPSADRWGYPDAQWRPSPNIGNRLANYVVIHHTTLNSVDEGIEVLTSRKEAVSSHYLVGREGSIVQLVDERKRAWHAGESWWGGNTDINSSSIGIELDNNGEEPFPAVQIEALKKLLADIGRRHKVPRANYLAHADVAPARKDDPSGYFPWRDLSQAGYGLWCDAKDAPLVPDGFDARTALAALGYDTRNFGKAVFAFKLHYSHTEGEALNAEDRAVLHCLVQHRAS